MVWCLYLYVGDFRLRLMPFLQTRLEVYFDLEYFAKSFQFQHLNFEFSNIKD